MFYEPSDINDLLICEHCSQPFDQNYSPKILPCCDKIICYKCVQSIEDQSKNNTYKCIACNKYEIMPSKGFQVNPLVLKLMEKQPKEVSRGSEANKMKQNLQELKNLVQNLIFEVEIGEYLITEECNALRKKIQLAKEEKIQELENHCDTLFFKIYMYEQKCKSKYKETNESNQKAKELIKLVNDYIQQKNAYLSQ